MKRVRVTYCHEASQWSATSPDAPGYTAVAERLPELRKLVREGLPFYLDEPVRIEERNVSHGIVAIGDAAFTLASASSGIGNLNSAQNDAEARVPIQPARKLTPS
jgi:hypothetical protein